MPSPFGGGASGGMGMSPFGLAAGGGGTPGKGHDAWRIGLQLDQSTNQMCHLFAWFFFSSPELKAQVSFSDHLSSVRPPVRPSIHPSENFSHFQLLLQNHWANFNKTRHKASLGDGDSSLFK